MCPACQREWRVDEAVRAFERCGVCRCTRFYRQKMFPRWLGIGLVVVGAIVSFWTLGLSLVAVFVVDLLIYRSVPEMAVCYQCRAEVRGVPLPDRVLGFRHHLAEGYEARRSQWIDQLTAVAAEVSASRGVTGTVESADSLTAQGDSEHDPRGS